MLLLASCASKHFTDSPYEPLTMEAIKQFYSMKESGRLPGISKDEHGDLQTGAIPEVGPVVYPVSVTLQVTVGTNRSEFRYDFIKDSKSSSWRLARALQMQPDGKFEDLKVQ